MDQKVKATPWTTEQTDYLRQKAGKVQIQELATAVGHSLASTKQKMKALGLTKPTRRWTEAEIEYLRTHAHEIGITMTIQQMADTVNHPKESTATKLQKLGCSKPRHKWTEEDDKTLRRLVAQARTDGTSKSQVAKTMGWDAGKINEKMAELGLEELPSQLREKTIFTAQQETYIQNNIGKISVEKIAEDIGISDSVVRRYIKAKGWTLPDRTWTAEEDDWLERNWGLITLSGIVQHLRRHTELAIKQRASSMRLGAPQAAGTKIDLNTLVKAVTGMSVTWRKQQQWIKAGLPVTQTKFARRVFNMVNIEDFWKWAEKHRTILDFSQFSSLSLGVEPDWVEEKRLQDQNTRNVVINRRTPWTEDEDNRLRFLIEKGEYTLDEIAEDLRRTTNGIRNRCKRLRLTMSKIRPDTPWTVKELDNLFTLVQELDTWTQIGTWSGRGATSCQNKAYFTYGTTDILKLREIFATKQGWDLETNLDARPIKTAKRCAPVKTSIVKLCGVLSAIVARNNDPNYWQSTVCQHWDLLHGCTKGESNCDSCPYFERIKPQYCSICGALIVSRTPKTICEKCVAEGKHPEPTKKEFEKIILSTDPKMENPYEKAAKVFNTTTASLRYWTIQKYGTSKISKIKEIIMKRENPQKKACNE